MFRKCTLLFLCISLFLTACGAAGSGGSVSDAVDDEYRNYYEIFVYSFADANGDGIGDLAGVTDKLDYIADLGCNGIWLMPVQPSPTYHKYDITDYTNIDPQYGTLADFDALIVSAHEKGIRVIIDLVINHTSSEHPWFQSAIGYLRTLSSGEQPDPAACPYVDYYHFATEPKDGAWYPVDGTPYFYEAVFWSKMPDLNLTSPEVLTELYDIADFWIGHGVDGFRMDAAMHYEENDPAGNADVLCKLQEYCRQQNRDFYIVSEVWASEQTMLSYYEGGAGSLFDFSHAGAEGDFIKTARGVEGAQSFVAHMTEWEEAMRSADPEAINAPFLTNHDMGRVSNALNGDPEAMKMAAALLLSQTGSPFIYYGEELGMMSKGTKDENKRLPMPWTPNGLHNTNSTGDYNCAGPADADDVTQTCDPVDKQLKDKDSLYHFYQKALSVRNRYPQIARGRSVVVPVEDVAVQEGVAVVYREWEGKEIYILYNTGDAEARLAPDELVKAHVEPGTANESAQPEPANVNTHPEPAIVSTLSVSGSEARIKKGELILPGRSVVYLLP